MLAFIFVTVCGLCILLYHLFISLLSLDIKLSEEGLDYH